MYLRAKGETNGSSKNDGIQKFPNHENPGGGGALEIET
jgi:hypothetical protein